MANRFPYSQRSKEAPMDYQWTNRSPIKPAWVASGDDDAESTRKRSHDRIVSPTPTLGTPQPTFGTNQNVPFLFQPAPAPPPPAHPWMPPPQFTPSKAFPDIKDVDMSEASPLRAEDAPHDQSKSPEKESESTNNRPLAIGGLRRVYNKRTKPKKSKVQRGHEEDEDAASESGEEGAITPVSRTTSNHYTLNMPAPAAPPSDLPYVLLGYLQFFFNLSLILIFLYLFIQFILTVQRDVEHRISEYSQDIIQEISMCAAQYRNNLCDTNPIPAMVQQCANWQTCMNRDPTVVGRAKVGAELIAEVVNGFVEPISWKTLIFTLTSLAFLTVFINTLLSLYRSKHQPIREVPPQPAPAFPIAPPTPFPAHAYNPYHTPGWGHYRTDDDMESPTRRRRLEGGAAAKIK
ncbi:hypothetical protein CVT24_000469 [Panaeolus cyanescens]|uniref:Brl1/Brr6 domain-containing protein n=1 Tax=Panaeolus cyanescens TaxID=181874 RepID=A0A409VCL3_9AGAR|nr:hypothetical protein CVT24_000469 [Panaeolus cyanescens]